MHTANLHQLTTKRIQQILEVPYSTTGSYVCNTNTWLLIIIVRCHGIEFTVYILPLGVDQL